MANFLICGVVGWCMEIIWTSFNAFRKREMKLKGDTSIWMFPIYGMGTFLSLIYKCIKSLNIVFRGLIYMLFIFITEYSTGMLLKKHDMCPWDYSKAKFNINGVIRLDYAPLWFLAGLVFEKIIRRNK